MNMSEMYKWDRLMTLIKAQLEAANNLISGRLGGWGKARFPVRQEKIDKLLYELLQRKVKTHGAGALEALRADSAVIGKGNQTRKNVTSLEIQFVWNILDGFARNERNTEPTSSSIAQVDNRNEDDWKQALVEFEGDSRRPGLWAKAFADAQGDEALARANYLSQRSTELLQERKSQPKQRKLHPSSEELNMINKIGIVFHGGKYHLHNNSYEHFSDAINGYDAYGYTPLMHAARKGDLNLTRILLSKGANPKSTKGIFVKDTALSMAKSMMKRTNDYDTRVTYFEIIDVLKPIS